MRDAAGELAHGFETLRLAELLFEILLRAAVDDEPGQPLQLIACVELSERMHEREHHPPIVVPPERGLTAGDAPLVSQVDDEALAFAFVGIQLDRRRRHHFVYRNEAEELREHLVAGDDAAVGGADPVGARRLFKEPAGVRVEPQCL